jgi:hypothetical protein
MDGGTVAVGTNEAGGQILYESWGEDCSTTELGPEPQATLPGGWEWLTDIGPCPFWWAAHDKHWVPYQRTRLDTPVASPDGPGEDGHTVPTDTPGLSEALALDHLIAALQSHPDQYGALIAWLEQQLGGGATSATPDGTPSCTGMTYGACVSAFEHAGFAGPFTKKTLDPDEAWIGAAGGSVVDTTPWADDQPDDQAGPVEIDVNPDVMPEWTADDEAVDQNIKANHEASMKRNEVLDVETLRKNTARQCRIRVMKPGSGRTLSDCWTMPMVITGGADARGPAENDWEALKDNPVGWVSTGGRTCPTTVGMRTRQGLRPAACSPSPTTAANATSSRFGPPSSTVPGNHRTWGPSLLGGPTSAGLTTPRTTVKARF